ncbi:HAMP domain-containing sensor histidine kinase [Sphingobacterium sp. DR205]|uniref:sensor histidine kinase n=1 Tax=Sphingobacterium sp. DR205 TaxID=2713573 RepID=UPI0013E51BEE|nr:HAMP domain-containing sensor histidine kinase [Sphingobacterium sp. DR205]QIH34029.1 HAMP domain-containing histidine kinase [Sphingobacterium sp. DR205]
MTTHRKTRIIITLLIASTIAVIVMQVFWLSDAFRINQQKEKIMIQGAVKDAIDVVRLKTYFGIDSSLSKEQSSILRAMGGILDQVSNNELKGVEIRRQITKDSTAKKNCDTCAAAPKKTAHEFRMDIAERDKDMEKKLVDSVLAATSGGKRPKNVKVSTRLVKDSFVQIPSSSAHKMELRSANTGRLKKQVQPTKLSSMAQSTRPAVKVYANDTRSTKSEMDTLAIGRLLDSLIKTNFENLQFKNQFKVAFSALADSTKQRLDSVDHYLLVRSTISPVYNAEITVKPDVLTSLQSMKWLFFVSLLILGMLFYTALALINSFNREKQMTEIKNDFISNMTHEFKTPIATASLAVELMSKFGIKDNPEKLDEYLNICGAELKRVSSMIETVLRLAQDDPYILEKEPTDLSQILHDFQRQTKSKLDEVKGTLTLTVADDFPNVVVDKTHLENILYNLLDNSLKYSRQAPDIQLLVSLEKQYFSLSFRDNGIGIPKDYVDRIFDQFFRVPMGNVHATKGFGLGLSYVKKIVELHGGTIRVESQLDMGTTFILHIPLKF